MKYRSMGFHRGEPNIELIKLGAQLGFNDIQFQTESGTIGPILDLKKRADEKGYFSIAKELGMTISIWVHELEDYDESWGQVALDNEKLWKAISERYDYIFSELLPEMDYLVLTVVETQINMTDSSLLEKLVMTIYEQCSKYGKKLIFRTFVWHPDEEESVVEALDNMPRDIMIMTKCVPQDWHIRSINDRLIGNVGSRTQFVELDIAGEYFRMDYVANCFTDLLSEQFKYWVEKGCEGLVVRVDRWTYPAPRKNIVLGQAQEANLWVLGYLASGKSNNTDEIWNNYAQYTFGEQAAKVMIEVLQPTGKVIAEGLCVGHETFGDTRENIPGIHTMSGRIASAYSDEEDELYLNPFHSNWSVFRWDESYLEEYHQIRKGHTEIIRRKTDDYINILSIADKSIELMNTIKGALPEGAYDFFHFKLEENKFHLIVMCEMQLAWLKASNRIYYCKTEDEKSNMMSEVKAHLAYLERLTERYNESIDSVWQGKHYHLKRGEYIDITGFLTEFKRYWNLYDSK